jgi:hypothetical protein
MRTIFLACVLTFIGPMGAIAQQARPSPVAVDSAIAFDGTFGPSAGPLQPTGEREPYATGLSVDSVMSFAFGNHLQAIMRPIVQRVGSTGQWNEQIWIATLRYERRGPIGVRVDAGLITPPVGLANLNLRPHLNPMISQPSSLFSRLPSLEVRAPRASLLGAIYPFGAVVTLSGQRWDARGGFIDSSPLRAREVFSRVNPPRFATAVFGGGITPVVGLRVGASLTRGGWLKAGESPTITTDRRATVATVETELSFRYTKLASEWTRDSIEATAGRLVASGWYVQGHQTLAARWYVAGRVEEISSPVVIAILGTPSAPAGLRVDRQRLNGHEQTLGYRLTSDITLRASHRARRGFGRPGFDHTAAVSVVFYKRWL